MPDETVVLKRLKADAAYPKLFAAAFPGTSDPVTYDNMAEAIASFERTLITRDRLDDFLKGDVNALTVFADVRVIPEHLKATYSNLKPFFNKFDSNIINYQ